MGYNVLDIINKLILIKEEVKKIYIKISSNSEENYAIKISANILARYQNKHIIHYKELKDKIKNDKLDEIDFVIYDKISFLIDEYKNKINLIESNPKNIKNILYLALRFQDENDALIIDIQGRLVKKEEDSKTKTYDILTQILNDEQKHTDELKLILKNYLKKDN